MPPPDETPPQPKPTNWPLFWVAFLIPAFAMVIMPALLVTRAVDPSDYIWPSYLLALATGPICGWVVSGVVAPKMPGRLIASVMFAILFTILGFILSFFGCLASL